MKTRFSRCLFVSLLALALLLCAVGAACAEKHPGLITITSGRSVGDGSYINYQSSGYPFQMTFTLDDDNMPEESCMLGIYNYDCDWTATGETHEYDIVHVNGSFVGVLTGENNTWNTAYMDVPLNILKKGENTITVYVGHMDNTSGEIVQNSSKWLLTIKWASVHLDGGKSENAPDEFTIKLQYANRTERGISCGAHATIRSEKSHSYNVEYSLVDKTGNPATTGQIVSSDRENVSGTNIDSTGHFMLFSDAPMGDYQIQATLRDMFTNEVYAYDSMTFNLAEVLEDSCKHEKQGSSVWRKREYHMLGRDNENYNSLHEYIDVYTYTCAKCGKVVEEYLHQNTEMHFSFMIPCLCGYVPQDYNPFISISFSPVDLCEPGRDFTVEVTCHDTVDHVSAVNNDNIPMQDAWNKTNNGDGTFTFTRTYTSGKFEAHRRYWTITAYSDTNRSLGKEVTNSLDILNPDHTHNFPFSITIMKYKILPPSYENWNLYHYLYSEQKQKTCTVCNATIIEEIIYHDLNSPNITLDAHRYLNGKCSACGYMPENALEITSLSGGQVWPLLPTSYKLSCGWKLNADPQEDGVYNVYLTNSMNSDGTRMKLNREALQTENLTFSSSLLRQYRQKYNIDYAYVEVDYVDSASQEIIYQCFSDAKDLRFPEEADCIAKLEKAFQEAVLVHDTISSRKSLNFEYYLAEAYKGMTGDWQDMNLAPSNRGIVMAFAIMKQCVSGTADIDPEASVGLILDAMDVGTDILNRTSIISESQIYILPNGSINSNVEQVLKDWLALSPDEASKLAGAFNGVKTAEEVAVRLAQVILENALFATADKSKVQEYIDLLSSQDSLSCKSAVAILKALTESDTSRVATLLLINGGQLGEKFAMKAGFSALSSLIPGYSWLSNVVKFCANITVNNSAINDAVIKMMTIMQMTQDVCQEFEEKYHALLDSNETDGGRFKSDYVKPLLDSFENLMRLTKLELEMFNDHKEQLHKMFINKIIDAIRGFEAGSDQINVDEFIGSRRELMNNAVENYYDFFIAPYNW